jgi:hypothetical protein
MEEEIRHLQGQHWTVKGLRKVEPMSSTEAGVDPLMVSVPTSLRHPQGIGRRTYVCRIPEQTRLDNILPKDKYI